MEITHIILLGFAVLFLFCIAFLLFCIWRALLGKSSVDLRLNTTLSLFMKKMEASTNSYGEVANVQDKLRGEIKEANRVLTELVSLKKVSNEKGD